MVNPVKVVFYFDLDETLMSVQLGSNKRSNLSRSAEFELSKNGVGVVHSPVIMRKSNIEYKASKIKALCRKEFKNIFDQIKAVNANAKKSLGEKVIFVNILTNATYTNNEIHSILNRFYNGIELDSFTNRNRSIPAKGDFMSCHFKLNYSNLSIDPGCVFLIDDSLNNCNSANLNGFIGIHMKTNPRYRDIHDSFTNEKKRVFIILNSILKIVNQSVQDWKTFNQLN